ncbi:MAG: QueT transporter family protein, partial [Clostridia bacterium]|nr:QueT transporter family protein [Clostridia bacterium]
CMLWDIIFGSIATLLGAVFTYYTSKIKNPKACFLAPFGAIISNTLIIPPILRYVYGLKDAYIFMSITVCIGEIISAGISARSSANTG